MHLLAPGFSRFSTTKQTDEIGTVFNSIDKAWTMSGAPALKWQPKDFAAFSATKEQRAQWAATMEQTRANPRCLQYNSDGTRVRQRRASQNNFTDFDG